MTFDFIFVMLYYNVENHNIMKYLLRQRQITISVLILFILYLIKVNRLNAFSSIGEPCCCNFKNFKIYWTLISNEILHFVAYAHSHINTMHLDWENLII